MTVTITEYNNALEQYKIAYESYLEGTESTDRGAIENKNKELKSVIDKIKNEIQKNKNELNNIKNENEKTDSEIKILNKRLKGEVKLSGVEKAEIAVILEDEYNQDIRNTIEILEEETRNEKLLKDLEEYSDKKKHTMLVLSIINIIFLVIIVVGLYLLITNKKFKIPNFNNKN